MFQFQFEDDLGLCRWARLVHFEMCDRPSGRMTHLRYHPVLRQTGSQNGRSAGPFPTRARGPHHLNSSSSYRSPLHFLCEKTLRIFPFLTDHMAQTSKGKNIKECLSKEAEGRSRKELS